MLTYTNAHRENFSLLNRIVRNNADRKYSNVISKIFPNVGRGAVKKLKKMKNKVSLQEEFMIHDNRCSNQYTYWDDPNELVERLQLLIASQSAGHNKHNNEIISIIEELREANIIH